MSEYKPEILFLKQEDVVAAGLLDMKMVLGITEKTFKMIGEGQIINPPKTMLGMPNNENWTSFCMSMPSYIGGDVDVAGFKWASESVFNGTQPDMPYGVDVVMLSDPKTVYPKAIMDGTLITAMRTSAAAGVAAKYLASKNSKKACLVGAGVIGRTMVMAMMEAVPSLEEIKLVDLDIKKAEGIAKEFEGKYNVIPCASTEEAAKDADIIVTETTSRKPFLKADKKVLDNWAQLSHGAGTLIHKLADEGKLTEDMVASLPQLASGQKPGRESEDELCVCATFGIGSVDVAVANQIYGGLQQIVSRRLHETSARVLSVCTIHSGPQDKSNIIPDCCTMTGTIRSDRREVMEEMKLEIKKVSEGIAEANGAHADVETRSGEAVINTPEAVPFCINAASKILGAENVAVDNMPHLGGEDFSEYITRVPGAYIFAGIATDETRGKFGLHSSHFILEESMIPKVAAVFSQMAVDFLEKGSF